MVEPVRAVSSLLSPLCLWGDAACRSPSRNSRFPQKAVDFADAACTLKKADRRNVFGIARGSMKECVPLSDRSV